jgi:uncharacterized protein YdiU (UPF0061 family)
MADYRPDPKILELGPGFYDPVDPARFPQAIPRFLNHRAATQVGLDGVDWERHFCRFEPLPANLETPLALRYHGHQFRHYNPDIGDGRGFLFAQLRDWRDRLLDLGTKGSGQTPYSRFGDGRLTLKGGIREVLATEMLEALGVATSRSFALFETGEELQRNDEPSPTRSAVLTRLSHSHVRIGSFQRCAFRDDRGGIEALTRYSLEHLFDEPADAGPARLFALVAERTARLAASYLAAGFVHGVLNTDNINITGESFDYGPWRFAPVWDEGFVAAYFDHGGLYAFGLQPEAIHWNLAQLAGCLALVADREPLEIELNRWGERFQGALVAALVRRLGVPPAADDRPLASAILAVLRSQETSIDRFFFDWRGGRRSHCKHRMEGASGELQKILQNRELDPDSSAHAYWSDEAPCSMHIDEVEAIWARIAEDDDWTAFDEKVAAIRRMADAMGEHQS